MGFPSTALGKLGNVAKIGTEIAGGLAGAGKAGGPKGPEKTSESKGDGETVVLDKQTFEKLIAQSAGGVGLGPDKVNTVGIG